MRILGADLALNHSGFVLLNEKGDMEDWTFTSDVKKHVASCGLLMPFAKKPGLDREQNNARRLHWWSKYLPTLIESWKPTHAGIEDYALSAKGQSMYQIGEIGGLLRLAALKRNVKVRLHDPLTAKMFAAHHGQAQPETVMMAVLERWPETQVWKDLELIPQIDLAVAYVMAMMVFAEIKLRAGKLKLESLHEKEIAVFNRTTQANPQNLLARDWITLG